jgi:hypothetical protein
MLLGAQLASLEQALEAFEVGALRLRMLPLMNGSMMLSMNDRERMSVLAATSVECRVRSSPRG